ncbi:MAG: VanZ family protein, partial [Steroidobacteraceae bacterium]|nr:VanZ family protein [Steroidobacteraceae bacterium]MDW8260720.1 VanZ family protein [Gammaproteobacteria bacterium]
VGNLLAYLPIGRLSALLLARGRELRALLAGTGCGALLSLAIEIVQLGIPTRVASGADWLANLVSSAAGALLAIAYQRARRRGASAGLRYARPDPIPLVLLAIWAGAHAAPFVPRASLNRMLGSLAGWDDWGLRDGTLLSHTAALLLLAAALRTLLRREIFWPGLLCAVCASWTAQIVFAQHRLSAAEVYAFVPALPLIAWLRRSSYRAANEPTFWLATALCCAAALAPWQPVATPNEWQFELFAEQSGYAEGLLRVFLVGGLLWTGARSRLGLSMTALVLATVFALAELAQIYVRSRVPDPTDFVLLALGVLLLTASRDVDSQRAAR